MDAIVFNKKVKHAATHAIVIGVGEYPHLPGGKGKPKFPGAAGMGQLKSPPESARSLARWLIEEYRNPDKPLASLSLLLSDSGGKDFTYRLKNKEITTAPPPATIQYVEPAIQQWRDAGHDNPDNLLLFFFCGHGIARGTDLSLLLSDFGRVPVAPLNAAIDFRRFRQGMDECDAREQCYFVDACRVGSELLIKNDGYAGRPIIERTGQPNTTGRFRQAPVFYSTLSDGQAYAKAGKPSLYTEALLEAFGGAGSGDEDGPWRIRTNLLHDALSFLVKDASQRARLPELQIASSEDLSSINLNVIASPQVPVVVSCRPEDANSSATLLCENKAMKKKRNPAKEPWILRLPVDTYDFTAKIRGKDYKMSNHVVRPTFRRVFLDVK